MKTMVCRCDRRREAVREKAPLNGLDTLDVSDDQRTLAVTFLGKAPEDLTRDNFRIEGGRRVRDIRIVEAITERNPDPKQDDVVKLRLDRYGDFSTYTLRLVNAAQPIDPCYDHLDFSFKINCPNDLDCRVEATCPPETRETPHINYLAKDYASFRQLIFDRLALIMPDWQERHVPDIGIALVELLAYTGDYLSYYQDAVATEAYLDTARRRVSVRRHARLVDYRMHEGCNARAWVCLDVTGSATLTPADAFFVTGLKDVLPAAGTVVSRDALRPLPSNAFVVFEPLVADPALPLVFREAHNTIAFYTWGGRQCCLPKGTTGATLLDGWGDDDTPPPAAAKKSAVAAKKKTAAARAAERPRKLALKPGDVLIFEEVCGPRTGDLSDADPSHRHAVRLTTVTAGIDPLDGTPILEIAWSEDDALPFPLYISALSDAEHGCVYLEAVSIARGNVLLVDHGMTVDPPETPDPGNVPAVLSEAPCLCEGRRGDVSRSPGPFRPTLAKSPITHRQPVDAGSPAAACMAQAPDLAVPQVALTGRLEDGPNVTEALWEPRFDLLESSADDAHFVVEIDNENVSHLRFGRGGCGRAPDAGTRFSAVYRVGNGKAGNVGSEAIAHLVYRNALPVGIARVRNPMAAGGGTDPEPIRNVKLLAPAAFRKELERAITADDYARIAERNPKVQAAGAELRWNGSWYEARVAVDPFGREGATKALRSEIAEDLTPFRRMGHDLSVVSAAYVSLAVAMEICVRPDVLKGHVKAALLAGFSNKILADGRRGFFHPDNLTFGTGIFSSRLVVAAMSVDGVESARVTRLERQFVGPDHEIENGVLPLGALEIGRCDNDPNYPEHGTFQLTLHGGR